MSHDDNGLTLSGRYPASGADGEDLHLTRPLLRFASGCSTRFAGLNHFRLLFRHICICPRWDTSLRGARGPVPHERRDLSALIVGCIVRAAYCGGRCEKMKSTAPDMAQKVNAINERTAKAIAPLQLNSLMIAMP